MTPRAYWKGQLRLSLVTFPVKLFNAVSGSNRISLNQLHKDCHQRLKQQMACPTHGPVERDDIVKGYEFEKGKYVVIDDADIEKIKIESQKTIELTQFVDLDEVDPIHHDGYYYVAPDGPVAQDAFRVIREAMRKNNKAAIGRLVLAGREHIVCLRPQDAGFVLTTLRLADEVRSAEPYFEDIKDGPVDPAHLKLAEQLIENATAELDLSQFSDRYQEGLLAVIKAKIAGSEPVIAPEAEVGQVINLMEALKASVAEVAQKKPPAASIAPPKAARASKAKRA